MQHTITINNVYMLKFKIIKRHGGRVYKVVNFILARTVFSSLSHK